MRPCSSVGRVTVDLIRRSFVRFLPRSKDFFFASCGTLFPFTSANNQWVIHGFKYHFNLHFRVISLFNYKLRDNLVILSTGLIMWIGHRKEIRKLTFRALALHRSDSHYQPVEKSKLNATYFNSMRVTRIFDWSSVVDLNASFYMCRIELKLCKNK